ncbi:MAG: hypothetical protein ACREFP_16370 [Acetobacteraceae bacterium]
MARHLFDPPRSDVLHLDEAEQTQRVRHTAPRAAVILEVVREEGEADLKRNPVALIGNTIGGVSLVALLDLVPLAQDFRE